MPYVIAISSLAALCGAWIAFQLWIARKVPDAPGINRRCDGCTGGPHCHADADNPPCPPDHA